MSERIPWVERKFNFDFSTGLYHQIMERLRGTPARVEDLIRSLAKRILTLRGGAGWSIQENVGHLLDLEALFMGRLDDFEAGAKTLRPADMSNRKTHEAGHNDKPIDWLLSEFRSQRAKLIGRLEQLDPDRFGQTALHPRLNQPMRIVDMMYFQSEHDDYHLARISQLARQFAAGAIS